MTESLTQDVRLTSLQQLVQDEAWHEALRLADTLLQDAALAAPTHALLAVVHSKQGRRDEAMKHCHQALTLHPEDALALFNLGTLVAQQGKPAEAVTYFEQAVTHAATWAAAHYNLGTVLLRLERYREAIDAFEQAIAHCREYPEAHFSCGNARALAALRADGTLDYYEFDRAVTAYKAAIQQRPDYTAALYNLGMLYKRRNSAEGLRVWDQYLEVSQGLTDETLWRLRAAEYKRDLQEHVR